MATVEVKYDNLPQGAKVEIPYLGVFENGSTAEVDENKWNRYLNNFPGAEQHRESGKLTLTTSEARKLSEARAAVQDAARASATEGGGGSAGSDDSGAQNGSEAPLEDRSKSELQDMASTLGIETEGKKKTELVEAIKAQS